MEPYAEDKNRAMTSMGFYKPSDPPKSSIGQSRFKSIDASNMINDEPYKQRDCETS